MKKTLSFLLTFFSVTFLLAQTDLQGSWQVMETTNLSDAPALSGPTQFTGQKFHFLEDDYLMIQSVQGDYLSSYQQEEQKIIYGSTELTIAAATATELTLQFKDSTSRRYVQLKLAPIEADLDKTEVLFHKLLQAQPIGAFRTNGYYHHYNESNKQYVFYRFLPDHRVLRASDPSEEKARQLITDALNGTSPTTLLFDQTNKLGQSVSGLMQQITEEQPSKRPPMFLYETSFQVSNDGNELQRIGWRHDLKLDSMTASTQVLQFEAAERLAYWLPTIDKISSPYVYLLIGLQPSDPDKERILRMGNRGPRFPGCENISEENQRKQCAQKKLLQYIYANVKYPAAARKARTEGMVIVSFVIQENGTLTNITIRRNIGNGCGEELLRIVNKMNEDNIRWIPGTHYGLPVKVYFNLPLKFEL